MAAVVVVSLLATLTTWHVTAAADEVVGFAPTIWLKYSMQSPEVLALAICVA